MNTQFKVTFDIPEALQQSAFSNATLQHLSNAQAMSIAVHLPVPPHARSNRHYLRGWLQTVFQTVLAAGGDVEIQIGDNGDTEATSPTASMPQPRKLAERGYVIVARETFLTGDITIHAFDGAKGLTATEIDDRHREILRELRARAASWEGSHVVYDPYADGEGWLMVGEADEIIEFSVPEIEPPAKPTYEPSDVAFEIAQTVQHHGTDRGVLGVAQWNDGSDLMVTASSGERFHVLVSRLI